MMAINLTKGKFHDSLVLILYKFTLGRTVSQSVFAALLKNFEMAAETTKCFYRVSRTKLSRYIVKIIAMFEKYNKEIINQVHCSPRT